MMRIKLFALLAAVAVTAPAPAARPARLTAVKLAEKTPLLDFSYSWPAQAAAIPKLDGRLRADARTQRQSALNDAREDRASRQPDFPFHAHSRMKTWIAAGDAGGLLSLEGEFYSYTGGAHGMSGFESILWDRRANRNIGLMSLFADPRDAEALLTRAFCPALNAERAKKRGAPVVPSGKAEDDWLTGCPAIAKQVLVPGAVKAGRFTRITVLIGPYEAGPYAEGSYEVALPVTPELVARLKPEWRRAF